MIKHLSIQNEVLFLEALYEQIDIGEPLYEGLKKASARLSKTSSFGFIARFLSHSERNGLSHYESLKTISAYSHCEKVKKLFFTFASYEKMGTPVHKQIKTLIQSRMKEAYIEMEKRIETAPVKLLAPLFLFTFIGVWLFIGATFVALMQQTGGPL